MGADEKIMLPVHLKRLILNSKKIFNIQSANKKSSELDPVTIIDKIERLLNKIVVVSGVDHITTEAHHNATRLFHNLVRSTLASKRVLREYKLTSESFEWLLKE